MKNKIILALALFLIIPTVFATTYTANEDFQLTRECFYEGELCDNTFDCYVTVVDPDGSIIVNNQQMTHQDSHYNYSMSGLSTNGEYRCGMSCSDGSNSGSEIFYFNISQTGGDENSLTLFLIIGGLAVLLLIFGVVMKNYTLFISSGMMFLLAGVYVLIYGLQFMNNLYTRGVAFTFIGLGLFFLIVSGYNMISMKKNDDF